MGNIYISAPRPAQKPIKDQAQHQHQLQLGAAITSLLGINYFGTSKISLRLIQTKAPAPKLHRLYSRLFQPACLWIRLRLGLRRGLQCRPEDSLSLRGTAPHANRVGTSTSRGNCKSQHCDSIAAAPKGFGMQSPPLSSSSSSSCLFRIELNLDMISCPVCFAVFGRLPFKSLRSLRSNWCFTCESFCTGRRYTGRDGTKIPRGKPFDKPERLYKSKFCCFIEYDEVCFQVLGFSMSYSQFYAHSQSRNCALVFVRTYLGFLRHILNYSRPLIEFLLKIAADFTVIFHFFRLLLASNPRPVWVPS